MRRLLVLALLLLAAAPLAAQRGREVLDPPRPSLWAQADTNDAGAYFNHGVSRIDEDPAEAAAAFFWAARLDPNRADALYGRRIAILLMDKERLVDYMNGVRRVERNPVIMHADSAYDRALVADPYLYRRFDRYLLETYLHADITRSLRRQGVANPNAAEISHFIQTWLLRAPASWRAWMAYSQGNFGEAMTQYGRAIGQARYKAPLRADRGRLHYLMGADSLALADMREAIVEWRKSDDDDDDVVWYYESKAMLEHSVGMIHERLQDWDAAREAYGRALQEDLSYYPAHVRLSLVALATGDTATAVSEMDLAVQVKPDHAGLRYNYGFMLATAQRYMEAVEQLQKAVELEPFYAPPYFLLARMYDGSGMTSEAIDHYRRYAERAVQRDPQHAFARARVDQLTAEMAAPVQAPAPAEAATAAETPEPAAGAPAAEAAP